jgi:hypothetical protein
MPSRSVPTIVMYDTYKSNYRCQCTCWQTKFLPTHAIPLISCFPSSGLSVRFNGGCFLGVASQCRSPHVTSTPALPRGLVRQVLASARSASSHAVKSRFCPSHIPSVHRIHYNTDTLPSCEDARTGPYRTRRPQRQVDPLWPNKALALLFVV